MPVNKGVAYDKMVNEKSGDELGIFEKYEETFEYVRSRISELGARTIIDFGCGTGNLCGPMSEAMLVTGIDKNIEMLQQGQHKFPSMRFIEGSFLDLSKIKESADLVVSSFVLHGLPHGDKLLAISNMMSISNQSRVILIDWMFESEISRQKCKKTLIDANRSDLWEFLASKAYFIVEDLKKYLDGVGLKASFQHVAKFTWIAEIYQ